MPTRLYLTAPHPSQRAHPVLRRWMGPLPDRCEVCGRPPGPFFIDGATRRAGLLRGSWALMCPRCHAEFGVGLGCGRGQAFDSQSGVQVGG